MQQSGEYRIGAPRAAVWAALNDPEILSRCIEGCESMTRVGDDAFNAVVRARIGPVSAAFNAEVKLADLDPPNAYTLQGSVKGGVAGFGRGTARVTLTDDGAGTILRYDVDGNVGGKLAQVGQRLIDGAARKMADDFFAAFSEIVAPTPADAAGPAGAEPAARPARAWPWAAGLALLAIAALVAWMVFHPA